MVSTIAVCLLLGVAPAFGITQFGPEWVRIGGCNELAEPGATRIKVSGGMTTIQSLAQSATQVKICEWNSTTDCVTSRPGTYPVMNLRAGILLMSHQNQGSAACNATCVRDTWDGPHRRLTQVTLGCGNIDHQSQSNIDSQWFYWACGNGLGLHMTQRPGGPCDWDVTQPGANAIEIFINAGTSNPTPAPTPQPTQWFEASGHQTNFTEVQSRLTAAEIEIVQLRAELSTSVSDRQSMAASILDLTAGVNSLTDSVQGLALNASQIRQALVNAATTAPQVNPQRPSAPAVSASGNDVTVEARGTISLMGRTCNADLCDVSSFSQRLQDALSQIEL